MKTKYLPLAVLSLLLAASPALEASPVTINNFSFESPVLSPGGYNTSVLDWTIYSGNAGIQYFGSSQFSQTGPLAAPADGNQAIYVYAAGGGGGGGGLVYQDVGALLPNTLYTLTVAVGNRADQNQPTGNSGKISLYNGANPSGTLLATSGSFTAPAGQFADLTLTYQTGPTVSGDLVIGLGVVAGNVQFDNVLLDATFSPSPQASSPTYMPNITPIYAGTPITLNELSAGVQPLSYQWLTDGGSGGALTNVPGATSTNLPVNTTSFSAGNFNYAVIVTNIYGASTSSVVTLNIAAASVPLVVTDIAPYPANEGYVGQTLTYSASFTGTLPITYQWMLDTGNGPTPIPVSSNPTAVSNVLMLSNLQLTNAGIYSVEAQNSVGGPVSSSSSTLTVLPVPPEPGSGTYASLILSENPVAYWRLNETEDPSTGLLPAYDATGHNFDGLYGANTYNGFDGVAGPQPPTFPGFESTNTALFTAEGEANSSVTVPPLNLDTNAVTITMWINPNGAVGPYSGLLMNRNNNDAAGLGFGNAPNTFGMQPLGYNWNTNSQAAWGFNSGLYPVANVWSFVALVVQTNEATLYLYYIDPATGLLDLESAVNPIPHGIEAFSGGTTWIGDDQNNVARVFNGSIDEVAVFNSALTPSQILAQFNKGIGVAGLAPIIGNQPQSSVVYPGGTVNITASSITGTSPITYQWLLGGSNVNNSALISGAQTPSLTISNVSPANAGTYELVASNYIGSTVSSIVTLSLVSPVPGSYEAAVLAGNPFVFWKLTETNDPSAGGVPAFEYIRGFNGTYQTAAQNGFNGILGPQLPGFPTSDTALATFHGVPSAFVSASAGTLVASNLTYTMWINPSGPVGNYTALLFDRSQGGEGFNFGSAEDGTGMSELGYTWNQNSTWSWHSGLFPPANQWSLVAMVIQPTRATLYLINSNGIQTAANVISHDAESFGQAWHIGDDPAFSGGSRTFPGSISGVAVYLSALSGNQITALYDAALQQSVYPVSINLAPAGNRNMTLNWPVGSLLQSTNLTGPWTTNPASSPYTIQATNSSMFFKIQAY